MTSIILGDTSSSEVAIKLKYTRIETYRTISHMHNMVFFYFNIPVIGCRTSPGGIQLTSTSFHYFHLLRQISSTKCTNNVTYRMPLARVITCNNKTS